MATSFLKKTMVYLGLLDDEYDEYDDYEERSPRGFTSSSPRIDSRVQEVEEPYERPAPAPIGRIRALPRDGVSAAPAAGPASAAPSATVAARTGTPSVRPMSPSESAKVQVVAPTRFGDAKEIADCLKGNRPVIVNLQVADRDLQRRMIDFCSGVTYALSGEMEKVADQVFLLAPTNVKVSDEERQRLQERGFGSP
jgi:cell division inhibitor SepF